MFDNKEMSRLLHCGFDLQPTTALEEVSESVEVLHVTRKTVGWGRLPELRSLRTLNAHDIDDVHFEYICMASQINYLAANIFGIKRLDPLRRLINLKGLELTDSTKFSSLDGLEVLTKLQSLTLSNCPVKIDLAPLSACKELRSLWLSSRYAKAMRVHSLSPLSSLTQLERLKMKNVRVEDKQLVALHGLTNLTEVDVPNFFPKSEFIALAAALPNARGNWLNQHAGLSVGQTAQD